jgi:hypothetical protein
MSFDAELFSTESCSALYTSITALRRRLRCGVTFHIPDANFLIPEEPFDLAARSPIANP